MKYRHQIPFGNLPVAFDNDFCIHQYISQVCKSCFYHIDDFRRIQRHLSLSTAKIVKKIIVVIIMLIIMLIIDSTLVTPMCT